MSKISETALLVTLNISQWTARRLDRRESADVEARNNATHGSARVNKALLPAAISLERVHKVSSAIRTRYYQLTLPWTDGMGIIKADAYLDFCAAMNKLQFEWSQAVSKFVAEYPDLRDQAQYQLGTLYDASDYPDPASIRSRFRMDIGFFPVPDNTDWRVSISADEEEELRRQLTEKIAESQGRAMQEAWGRVFKVVEKAHERLSDPSNIFRDSLIENARDLCSVLPMLNIANDPELEKTRRAIEQSLCQYDPQVLREDEGVRQMVSDKLADIKSKMGMFYAPA